MRRTEGEGGVGAARGLLAFAAVLRGEHGFLIGSSEVADALRALEVVGIGQHDAVRDALRPVLAASREQAEVFDALFDAFFLPREAPGGREGLPGFGEQPRRSEKTRDGRSRASQDPAAQDNVGREEEEEAVERSVAASAREGAAGEPPDRAELLRARLGALSAAGEPPRVSAEGLSEMRAVAARLVARLARGRSRKWRPNARGRRLDARRTLRASLASGGDPAHPKWLGHPRRNPRFLLVLDGSRSMSAHLALMLQFAYALLARARRAEVFFFSTELRRATPELRRMVRRHQTGALPGFGAAWGGGTRIGDSLARLIREHAELLGGDTLVFVLSDGLDVGAPEVLERAARELARRTAGVVWLNPLLATPGYAPSARGMRAALPHVMTFASAGDLAALRALAERIELRR